MFTHTGRPIGEHEARGQTARIYHEIRQTLRVSGVNLNFRTWAGFPVFFPLMWEAMQPIAAAQAFETASDRLRARAVDLAFGLPALGVRAALGESQAYQLQQALALYHYINPKLLLFTILVGRGLQGSSRRSPTAEGGRSDGRCDARLLPRVPFGAPPNMAAMEMVDEAPDDPTLRRLFSEIRRTLRLSSLNSDYRTLALWPDYLDPAWSALAPVATSAAFADAQDALTREARQAADTLPVPAGMDLRLLAARGESAERVLETTVRFARLLPGLILNITLLSRDWRSAEHLRASPFPVGPGLSAASPS